MAGVLGQLIRPQKKAVGHRTSQVDATSLELEAAKEILAEVFRVRLSDVDEMILSRFEAAGNGDTDNEILAAKSYGRRNSGWESELLFCFLSFIFSLPIGRDSHMIRHLSQLFTNGILVCIKLKFGVKVGSGKQYL